MEINVKEKIKIVEIWLSHNDQEDPQTLEIMHNIIQKYKKLKYKTAILYSGNKDFVVYTKSLLKNNI